MKRILQWFITATLVFICLHAIVPEQQCHAELSYYEKQQVEEIIKELYGTDLGEGNRGEYYRNMWIRNVENGEERLMSMTPGAYWYSRSLEARISSLEGNVGAGRKEDFDDVKNKVDSTSKETQDKIDNSTDKIIDAGKDKSDTNTKQKEKTSILSGTLGIIDFSNKLWGVVEGIFFFSSVEDGQIIEVLGYSVDIEKLGTGDVYTAMKAIAYSLVLLFFSISIIENVAKYEMITLKGIVTMTIRIVVSKYLIDNSAKIFLKIIQIVREAIFTIISKTGQETLTGSALNKNELKEIILNAAGESDLWVIAKIVDIVMVIIYMIPVTLIAIIVCTVAAIILIKVLIWSIDLVVLIVMSPVYIACWSSDATKQYCRKFVVTFIQASVQLLYMAVVFCIFKTWLISTTPTSMTQFSDFLSHYCQFSFILIVMAIMIVKPPKYLKNMLST